jgi:hypothetical protein
VRALVVLIAIASGCDLQPPPKKAPPAATPAATPPVATPNVPAVVPVDAGVAVAVGDAPAAPKAPVDAMGVTDRCVTLGSHVAAVLLSEASDPSKKAALIQDRAKIVRRTAESCTRDAWNEALIGCYLGAKTQVALQACRKPEPTPAAGAPPVPSGSGPR